MENTIDRNTIVNVYHDDDLVFTGKAQDFIRNNDNDEEVAELTDKALENGTFTYLFVSGEWTVSVA